eukprot:scaffold103558_cov36-Phaeocystis_antarctica.AAC.1
MAAAIAAAEERELRVKLRTWQPPGRLLRVSMPVDLWKPGLQPQESDFMLGGAEPAVVLVADFRDVGVNEYLCWKVGCDGRCKSTHSATEDRALRAPVEHLSEDQVRPHNLNPNPNPNPNPNLNLNPNPNQVPGVWRGERHAPCAGAPPLAEERGDALVPVRPRHGHRTHADIDPAGEHAAHAAGEQPNECGCCPGRAGGVERAPVRCVLAAI